ncbi:hypothetical protein MTO96_051557 [Rhipicephalus appendiculatus]
MYFWGADRTCKARYKTPYIVKQRRWERRQQDSRKAAPVSNNAYQRDSLPPSKTRRPGTVKIPFTVQIQVTEPNTWTTSIEGADVVEGTQHTSEEATSQNALNKLE